MWLQFFTRIFVFCFCLCFVSFCYYRAFNVLQRLFSIHRVCPPPGFLLTWKSRDLRGVGANRAEIIFSYTFPIVSLPDPRANSFIRKRAQFWSALARRARIISGVCGAANGKKQTSVKFKMSVVNLLERLHLSRNMNTCSLIAFFFFFFFFCRGQFLFYCCHRHRCAHWDFSASFSPVERWQAVKSAKRPPTEMWWVNLRRRPTRVYITSWKKEVSNKRRH